jgi:hypothetical protein
MQQHCEERNKLPMGAFLKLSWRTSENSVTAKFAEFVFHVPGCVASLDLDKRPQYGSTTNSASGP